MTNGNVSAGYLWAAMHIELTIQAFVITGIL